MTSALAASCLMLAGCAAESDDADSEELSGADETMSQHAEGISGNVAVGTTLIATANVKLRTGPSTSYTALRLVPAGSSVTVVASAPVNGFYKIKHHGTVGWSYGAYYKAASNTNPPSQDDSEDVSGSDDQGAGGSNDQGAGGSDDQSTGSDTPPPPPQNSARAAAMSRAKSGVGFSYWWGHGRFRPEGPTSSNKGSCSGSCPNCSHSGSYGGDCSGFAGKVWQVPSSNSDMSVDSHPYSTANFVYDTSLWSTISRSSLEEADALVYNSNGAGHIFIYSSGDGWGSMHAYECKGCAYGCVYNLRTATSAYKGIRRAGY